MVALAGCSAVPGGGSGNGDGDETPVPDEGVDVANDDPEATDVNQTLRIAVDESTAGSELAEIGATYPRDRFAVDAAQHDSIVIGIDQDGDGELDREFDETHVSGVNNNEYSFDVTLDTDYTLQEGDVVVVRYPAVDNPAEPGDYEVEIRLNDGQTETVTVTIE